MPVEDLALADIGVRQEPVCRLGVRPVLTRHRDRRAHSACQLRHQRSQPSSETGIPESLPSQLLVDPALPARHRQAPSGFLRYAVSLDARPLWSWRTCIEPGPARFLPLARGYRTSHPRDQQLLGLSGTYDRDPRVAVRGRHRPLRRGTHDRMPSGVADPPSEGRIGTIARKVYAGPI